MNNRKYLAAGMIVLAIVTLVVLNGRVREGFVEDSMDITKTAYEGQTITQEAPPYGGSIADVMFASYGTPSVDPYGRASKGDCHADILGEVKQRCVGKPSCEIAARNDWWGDPCHGTYKKMVITFRVIAPPSPELIELRAKNAAENAAARARVREDAAAAEAAAAAAAAPTPPPPGKQAPLPSWWPKPYTPEVQPVAPMPTPVVQPVASVSNASAVAAITTPPSDSLAAPEPVEFNWPVIGTIIAVVSVLILGALFYPSSTPASTGGKRAKRI